MSNIILWINHFHNGHKCDAVLNMKQLTISQILLGTNEFRRLIGCSGQTLKIMSKYLNLIKLCANGKVLTVAK